MSKLRKVQFYRNTTSSGVTSYSNHRAAIAGAQAVFEQQMVGVSDGEPLLYRYKITGESDSPIHTLIGVVKNDGATQHVTIVDNHNSMVDYVENCSPSWDIYVS